MITRQIRTSSEYIVVQQTMPYVNTSNQSNKCVGQMTYNNGNTQVYDGNSWFDIGSDAYLDFSPKLRSILSWAEAKIEQEQKVKQMAVKYPAVADLQKTIDSLNSQLDMVIALCKE